MPAVTPGQRLGLVPVEARLAKVRREGWRRLGAGDGAEGPRLHDRAYLPHRGAAPGWQMGLPIRRGPAKPGDPAYHLAHAPEGTTLARLVRVAGTRRTVEARFEAAGGEVGLDHHEVRSWVGRHRHIALAMPAHACRAAPREAAPGGSGRARPRRRTAAHGRAGGPPSAPAPRLGPATRTGCRAPLVGLAQAPPAARPPSPLAQADAPR